MVAREQIDVLVVDDEIVGSTAAELLAEFAREHAHIPRILLAGRADLNVMLAMINQAQIFRVLRKPCNADELAVAIRSALRKTVIASLTDRLMNLSRRQITLLEELDREATAAGEPPPGSHMLITGEVPAISNGNGVHTMNPEEVDPVAMLSPSESASLSRREKELLRAVVAGKKPRALARTFFISVHTVRNHIKAIYRKLSVHSQGELIAKVLRAPGRRDYRSAG
jgi:DNA-binding NarL/FixJ family response regulator